MSSSTGIVSSYLHASQHPEVARIVGLVTLEPEEGGQRLEGQELEVEVGASLAMHVVAAKPLFLSKELVAGTALQQELDIFRSQVLQDFFV
jgi:translation elongation factor EF-Ts